MLTRPITSVPSEADQPHFNDLAAEPIHSTEPERPRVRDMVALRRLFRAKAARPGTNLQHLVRAGVHADSTTDAQVAQSLHARSHAWPPVAPAKSRFRSRWRSWRLSFWLRACGVSPWWSLTLSFLPSLVSPS